MAKRKRDLDSDIDEYLRQRQHRSLYRSQPDVKLKRKLEYDKRKDSPGFKGHILKNHQAHLERELDHQGAQADKVRYALLIGAPPPVVELSPRQRWRKKYRQKPEIKEKNREYDRNRREKALEYQRDYRKQDFVKEKARKYNLSRKEKMHQYYIDHKERYKGYSRTPHAKKVRQEYNAKPEVKERHEEYEKRPEVREMRARYRRENAENIKKRSREYRQRPEAKEGRRAWEKRYRVRSGVRERRNENAKQYREKSGVKEKRATYMKEYRNRPGNKVRARELRIARQKKKSKVR